MQQPHAELPAECCPSTEWAGQGTARAEGSKELMHQTGEVTQARCGVVSKERCRMNHQFLSAALPLRLRAGACSFPNKHRGFGVN